MISEAGMKVLGTPNNPWPGGFVAGQVVETSVCGKGVVASEAFCCGAEKGPRQPGQVWDGMGVRPGLVPVIHEKVGCFWVGELQVNLIQKSLGPDPSSTLPMEIKSRR